MRQIIFLIVLIATIYLMSKTKKQVPDGQTSQEPLTGQEKLMIWILCFLNPIIAGAIFYYGWKTKLPVKAKSANQISLWAFLILIIVAVLAVFSGLIKA